MDLMKFIDMARIVKKDNTLFTVKNTDTGNSNIQSKETLTQHKIR